MKKNKLNIKTLGIFLLAIYFSVLFVRQELSTIRISKDIDKANSQLLQVKEKENQLSAQLKLATSKPEQFGEKQVRERLGYIKENETPVMPRAGSK